MKISQVVEFLEKVKEAEGDLNVVPLTGFWVRTIPRTGERFIQCAVGDAQSLAENNER